MFAAAFWANRAIGPTSLRKVTNTGFRLGEEPAGLDDRFWLDLNADSPTKPVYTQIPDGSDESMTLSGQLVESTHRLPETHLFQLRSGAADSELPPRFLQ